MSEIKPGPERSDPNVESLTPDWWDSELGEIAAMEPDDPQKVKVVRTKSGDSFWVFHVGHSQVEDPGLNDLAGNLLGAYTDSAKKMGAKGVIVLRLDGSKRIINLN